MTLAQIQALQRRNQADHADLQREQAKPRRRLKVEERGDFYRHQTIPSIRLKGKWLQAAGLVPGEHVEVTVINRGILELRVIELGPDQHQPMVTKAT